MLKTDSWLFLQNIYPCSSASALLQTGLLPLLDSSDSKSALENLLMLSLKRQQRLNQKKSNDIKKITRRQGFADLIITTPAPLLLQTVAGYPITVPPAIAASLAPPMASSVKGKGNSVSG